MDKKIQHIVFTVFGIAVGVIFAKYFEIKVFEFTLESLIVAVIVIVAILVINFLIVSGKKSTIDAPHALGLPIGSVRAILAITMVILFVLVAIFFYLTTEIDNHKKDLAESILTILGTLVIAISSFYFGIRATEQGSKIAQDAFKDANRTLGETNVPPLIIQEAISNNKEIWIKEYDCVDIKLGKKVSGQTQFELNCIDFFVNPKKDQEDSSKEIPPTITYNSKGKEYKIPTDVKEAEKKSPAQSKTVSLDIVEGLIIERREEWLNKYKADAIIAALKIIAGNTQETPCIQFIVETKTDLLENAEIIPGYFMYDGYKILTDVKQEDQPTEDSAELQMGDYVNRKGSSSKGTIGLKVYRDLNGIRTDYILSCYHVFCYPELKEGKKIYSSNSKSSVMAQINGLEKKIADVTEGVFGSNIDAALSKIKDEIVVSPALKSFPNAPKHGIRIITNNDVLNRVEVFSYGARSHSRHGYVIARTIDRKINFFGREYTFKNVIPVSKISVPGDSGAMVVDDKNKIIGIVFASNSSTSYIIPISEIIIHFNIKIYYA